MQKDEVINTARIIWADFLSGRDVEPKIYTPVGDLDQLITKMDAFQEEYNNDNTFVVGGSK